MENVATNLLDFILSLLNDPEAMADYLANREGALSAAGLGGCGDEVDAALTSAGAGHSLYYASANFHHSDWSDDRDVVFVRQSDDDGIDDSFNTVINDSFNTTTTINDNDFTNNGVIIDGDGNTVDNTVSDDDTTTTNVNSNNTTVEGDVTTIEGDVIGGDDNSIEEGGPGSAVVGDQSTGDVEDSIVDNDNVTQTGVLNVNDVLSPNLNVAPDLALDVL